MNGKYSLTEGRERGSLGGLVGGGGGGGGGSSVFFLRRHTHHNAAMNNTGSESIDWEGSTIVLNNRMAPAVHNPMSNQSAGCSFAPITTVVPSGVSFVSFLHQKVPFCGRGFPSDLVHSPVIGLHFIESIPFLDEPSITLNRNI